MRALIASALALAAALVALGARPGRVIGGSDALSFWPVFYREMAAGRASLRWMGGAELGDLVGDSPMLALGRALGWRFSTAWDAAVFVTLLPAVHFATRAIASSSGGAPRVARVASASLVATAFVGFAPVVAIRLGVGHLNLVAGAVPFVVAVATLALVSVEAASATDLVVAAVAGGTAVAICGQQTLLASWLLGAPMLVGLALDARRSDPRAMRRALGVGAALAVGALVASPEALAMLRHARSSDWARAALGREVVRSFGALAPRDLLASLFYGLDVVAPAAPADRVHEAAYALGPLAAAFLVAGAQLGARAWVGTVATVALVVALALDLRPASDAILAVAVPLRAFRVPARAVIAFAPALALLVARPLFADAASRRGSVAFVVAALVAAALRFVPSSSSEPAIALVAVVALAAHAAREGSPLARSRRALALVALGGALGLAWRAVAARVPTPGPFGPSMAAARGLHDRATALAPALRGPLRRLDLGVELPDFQPNTAVLAGLSSLNGYGHPTARFARLFEAATGARRDPMRVFYRVSAGQPGFDVLAKLYDVEARFALDSAGAPVLSRLAPTFGEAWFAARLEAAPDLASLVDRVRALASPDAAYVLEGDPKAPATLAVSESCREARALGTSLDAEGRLVVRVSTRAECPLVVAASYLESARVTGAPGGAKLATFPAYGALLATMVPPGVDEIAIDY